MDLHLFSQLIFNKNANTTQWKMYSAFSRNGARPTREPCAG